MAKKKRVIGPMIMKDARGRGFYIGTMKWDWDFGKYLPYERESDFYPTAEEVNNVLADRLIKDLR